MGDSELFVAPSIGGAASGAWDVGWWRALAGRVG
jgi:hypothetical protein